jgi:hypothetical protein
MKFLSRLIGAVSVAAISKGILIWLGSQHKVHPEQWVARAIGMAEDGVTTYPAISWVISGVLGIIGIFFGPLVYRWSTKVLQKTIQAPSSHSFDTRIQRLNNWRTDEKAISKLRGLRNEHTTVKVIYFDKRNFPFAERLAATFQLADWIVEFNKTPQGDRNPRYFEGIEIKGDNRVLVETVANLLRSTGCHDIGEIVGATEIPEGHEKYPKAKNKIYLTIGYEQ